MKNKLYKLLIISLFSFGLISCDNDSPTIETKIDKDTYINFYAVNDFHGQILEDLDNGKVGLNKSFSILKKKKIDDPDHTIILSSGDMFQGTFESNNSYGEFVINAMNSVGFDSMTIGNHEFDWGIDKLSENKNKMNFPLLGNNIFYDNTNKLLECLSPYTIIEKDDFKIGIIGSIQPGIQNDILKSISSQFDYADNIDITKSISEDLYLNKNCDVVVLSSHDGNFRSYKDLVQINPKNNRPYIEALFLGHDHNLKSGKFTGTTIPYIEGGCNSYGLSNIKLELSRKDGITTVKSREAKNYYFDELETYNDEEINNICNQYKSIYEDKRDEVVGYIDSFMDKNEIASLVSKALYFFVNDHLDKFKYSVSIGIINTGGGIRSTLSSGLITYGDIYSCIPFENNVVEANCNESEIAYYEYSYDPYIPSTINKGSDGLYHVATVNYVAESTTNTSITYSDYLYCDAFVEAIRAGKISEISPRGN